MHNTRKTIVKCLIIPILLLPLQGCNNYTDEVQKALDLAGSNAPELIKVLDHYKWRTREKYKAACFLIANMPYHYSRQKLSIPKEYYNYFTQIDSIYSTIFNNMSSKQVLSFKSKGYDSLRYSISLQYAQLPTVRTAEMAQQDIATIKAEYLIENIDYSFQIWKENPYAKELGFSDFLEFILPYRTSDESPFSKTDLADLFYKRIYADKSGSLHDRMERYKSYLNKYRWLCHGNHRNNHMAAFDLFLNFKSNCHNTATWTTNALRACGIPTVYEYTPQWQDRNKDHFWCATVDSAGIVRPYTPPENNMMEDWKTDLKYAGKVYRRTFGINKKTPYFQHAKNEDIPEGLSSPTISDQTYRYHQTVTLRIPFTEKTENRLAYLCFFSKNETGLAPVAWGTIDKKQQEVVFEQVPLNIVFFPVYYQGDELIPFGDPFMLQTAKTISWLPQPHTQSIFNKPIGYTIVERGAMLFRKQDNKRIKDIQFTIFATRKSVQDITLLMKYPPKRRLAARREKLRGAVIIASQKETGPYDTLYTVKTTPLPYLQEASFSNTKRYRYYYFATKKGGDTNISYMEFLGKHSNTHHCVSPTKLPLFSPAIRATLNSKLWRIEGKLLDPESNAWKAFDDDMETYSSTSRIGLDFGTPVCIKAIRFVPRNGNNMIVIGDTYALYYYNKGWQQHALQKATTNFITFLNVPSGTIYWLENLTQGYEELPFFYINGKQLFININSPGKNNIY